MGIVVVLCLAVLRVEELQDAAADHGQHADDHGGHDAPQRTPPGVQDRPGFGRGSPFGGDLGLAPAEGRVDYADHGEPEPVQ